MRYLHDRPADLEDDDEYAVVEGHPPQQVVGVLGDPAAPTSYEEQGKRTRN